MSSDLHLNCARHCMHAAALTLTLGAEAETTFLAAEGAAAGIRCFISTHHHPLSPPEPNFACMSGYPHATLPCLHVCLTCLRTCLLHGYDGGLGV